MLIRVKKIIWLSTHFWKIEYYSISLAQRSPGTVIKLNQQTASVSLPNQDSRRDAKTG
ncbi:lauroyl/myristoyl acyltransferase [Oxalobacteraceae bacterium GrIS 2.11]